MSVLSFTLILNTLAHLIVGIVTGGYDQKLWASQLATAFQLVLKTQGTSRKLSGSPKLKDLIDSIVFVNEARKAT